MFQSIRLKSFLVSLALPLGIGFLSNLLSGNVQEKYSALALPAYAPPGWVFGVVWPILYVMIGIAAYFVWESKRGETRTRALIFYGVQLFLNFLWSPLFFGAGFLHAAFWLLGTLLVMALATTGFFAQINKKTLWLLLPYDLWLAFAMLLNRAVITLNG